MGEKDDEREEEDSELFRRAMRDVQPIKRAPRVPAARRGPRPRAKFARGRWTSARKRA